MKKFTLIYAFVILICIVCKGQDNQTNITLSDLETPNSPSFILLDISPSSIEKPTTPKAFSTSIINSINQSNGAIPSNFAMEFSPYWFIKHTKLTPHKYFGITEDEKSRPFSSVRNFSISIATVSRSKEDSLMNMATNNIAIGFKLTLVAIRSKKNIQRIDSLSSLIGMQLKDISDDFIEPEIFDYNSEKDYNEARKIWRERVINSPKIVSELVENEIKIKKALVQKPIFSIEIAYANSFAFDSTNWNNNELGRVGAWLTLNSSFPLKKGELQSNSKDPLSLNTIKNYLNIQICARYLSNDRYIDEYTVILNRQDIIDVGGKLECEFNRLSISGEFLWRENFSMSKLSSNRWSLNLNYKINDGMSITGAFGKNYGNVDNLITQLGLSWGFGSPTVMIPESK